TPTEVMEVAGRVLAAATDGLVPPRSVRTTGEPPVFTEAGDLVAGTVKVTAAERALVEDGKVAVIAPAAMLDELRTALDAPDSGSAVLEQAVAVFSVEGAKGLEFDAVVVVEPA